MSLKNVMRLGRVYARSYRLISKKNFRKYSENRWGTVAIYALAIAIGVLSGAAVDYLYISAPGTQALLYDAIVSFFVTLPTLCILYSLIFMMMFQIQQTGVKASVQPLYWFPVTWEEHTAASVLASTYSAILWITTLLCSAVLSVSVAVGLPLAILTSIGLFLCMAMTGTTMEAFRVLMVGVSGAVMKVAGKSAVWVRFVAIIVLLVVVYAVYFMATSSMGAFFNAISRGQLTAWFVPYVWPGLALYAFSRGMWLDMALLSAGSVAFAALLFAAVVRLNARYGLSDAPTISVSRAYKPGSGLLGKLGLSVPESAIVKKDFKAFTRRTELMHVFIMPIVFLMATFMPLLMNGGSSLRGSGGMVIFYYVYISLFPAAMLAMTLGIYVVGSEGERFWLLPASPLPAKSLVRAKYFICAVFGSAVAIGCSAIGYVMLAPAPRLAVTGLVEAVLLMLTLGIVSLSCGIAGADFRELPRPRMIRQDWSLITMVLDTAVGLLVVLPVLAYGIVATFGILPAGSVSGAFLYVAWAASGAIALAAGYLFYRFSIRNAGKLMDALD